MNHQALLYAKEIAKQNFMVPLRPWEEANAHPESAVTAADNFSDSYQSKGEGVSQDE